jgi:hypothetical protein
MAPAIEPKAKLLTPLPPMDVLRESRNDITKFLKVGWPFFFMNQFNIMKKKEL